MGEALITRRGGGITSVTDMSSSAVMGEYDNHVQFVITVDTSKTYAIAVNDQYGGALHIVADGVCIYGDATVSEGQIIVSGYNTDATCRVARLD